MAVPTVTPTPTAPPLERRDEIVLPLTTIFTPPNDCLTAPFTLEHSQYEGETWAWRDILQTSSSCYPSSFSSLENRWYWYSPGVCPSGYNIAQSRSWSAHAAPMTQAWCCPEHFTISGMSMSGYNYQYCTSTANGASAISIDNNSTIFTSLSSFVAVQWPLSIEWASSDLPAFTPQSAPILVAAATTIYSLPSNVAVWTASAALSPTITSSTSVITTQSHASGLSTGAKAGIAVGVALAAILAAAGLVFWCLARRRLRQKDNHEKNTGVSDETRFFGGKHELPSDGRQISSDQPVEMSAVQRSPLEMEASTETKSGVQKINRSPIEMEGDYQPLEAPAHHVTDPAGKGRF